MEHQLNPGDGTVLSPGFSCYAGTLNGLCAMQNPDIPSLGCVLRCAAQSPPGCCGGRHLERGVQEAVQTPVKPLASPPDSALRHGIALASPTSPWQWNSTSSAPPFEGFSHIDPPLRRWDPETDSASPAQAKRYRVKDAQPRTRSSEIVQTEIVERQQK